MVKKNFYIQLLLLMFLTTSVLRAQNTLSSKDEKAMLQKAESYYFDEDQQNIPKALELFEELSKNKPNDPYYRLMEGICYTFFRNKKTLALSKLLEVTQNNPTFNEVSF